MTETEWIRNPSDALAVDQGCYFDPDAGSFVCDFVETFCKQSKGRWAGKPLVLLDWQREIIMRLFGWTRPDGLRRFRRAYVEVAKKQGKSTLVSALTLYLLVADGEGAPEIYLNACDRAQARIIFDEAKRMVESSPGLSKRLQTINTRNRILHAEGNGVIIANSADAPNKDGLNPSATIFDELHRQPNSELWDVFEYASAARQQPLTISITTAGEDESGVWFEQRQYSERVNRGEIDDITHLGVVYRADPEDDISCENTWKKANPSLGETISVADFARELKEALETPRKLANFKRLRLNIVSKADTIFLAPEDWAACGSDRVDPDMLRGKPCYAGADLSRTTDLTALVVLWGDEDEGYDVWARCYLPEDNLDALARADRQPYRLWVDQGYLTATPGAVVDYEWIRRDILDIAADHDLYKLMLDPYNATQFATQLAESDGLPVEFVRQGFKSLSPPTKELERLVMSRKLRHGNNPILRWMAGNAVSEMDPAGLIKLTKRKSREKIDGMAALVTALAGAIGAESGYHDESGGILVL